jgi:hypothetical protein
VFVRVGGGSVARHACCTGCRREDTRWIEMGLAARF